MPGSRRLDQDAQPAKRIDFLVFGAVGGWNGLPPGPVKSICPDDIITLDRLPLSVAVAAEINRRVIGIDAAYRRAAHAENDVALVRYQLGDQVLQHLVLRVDRDAFAATQTLDVDVVAGMI